MFANAFLADTLQATAVAKVHFVSAHTFVIIFPNIPLCLSLTPLLHGDSAAVVQILELSFSPISLKSWLPNSNPLSVRIFPGAPNVVIQILRTDATIVSFLLFGITHAALNLVAWSIIWSINEDSISLRSIAMVSLNSFASDRDTTGFNGVFLNF